MITIEINNTHNINPFEDDITELTAINYNNYLIDSYKAETKVFKDQTLKYFFEARAEQRRPKLELYIKDFITILSLKSNEIRKGGYFIDEQDNQIEKYYKEMVNTCKKSKKTLKDVLIYLDEKLLAVSSDIIKQKKSEFDNYETALIHYFLEQEKIEPMIFGKDLVKKYHAKKVEVFVNELRNSGIPKNRRGLAQSLNKIAVHLNDYPLIKATIKEHLTNIE